MHLWDDTVVSPQWLTSQQVFFLFFAAENDLAVLRQLFVLVRLSFTPCKTKQMKMAETTDGEKTYLESTVTAGRGNYVSGFAKWLRKCPTGYLCRRLNVCANPHTMTVPSTWPVNIEGLPKSGEPARPCVTHMTLTLPVWQLCLAGPLAVSWLNFPSSLSPIVGKHRIPQRRRA